MSFEQPIIDSYKDIVKSFTSNRYFGLVHSVETPSEGLDSYYFVELKPQLPENKQVQFAVLWRLLEQYESPQNYDLKDIRKLNDRFRQNFQYYLENWNPKPLTVKDSKRIVDILSECNEAIFNEKRKTGRGTNRASGYYLNDKFKGKELPTDVKKRILNPKSGYVLESDWNEFMVLLENKGNLSMFYWATGA